MHTLYAYTHNILTLFILYIHKVHTIDAQCIHNVIITTKEKQANYVQTHKLLN